MCGSAGLETETECRLCFQADETHECCLRECDNIGNTRQDILKEHWIDPEYDKIYDVTLRMNKI